MIYLRIMATHVGLFRIARQQPLSRSLIPVCFPLAAFHGFQQDDGVADFVQDRIEHIAVEMIADHGDTPLQEKIQRTELRWRE